jgi:hypothetical protein
MAARGHQLFDGILTMKRRVDKFDEGGTIGRREKGGGGRDNL